MIWAQPGEGFAKFLYPLLFHHQTTHQGWDCIWKDTFSSVFFWDGAVKSEWGYFKKTLADSKVVPFSSCNSHKIFVRLKNIYKLKAISCISYAFVLALVNSTKASLNWDYGLCLCHLITALKCKFRQASENISSKPTTIASVWIWLPGCYTRQSDQMEPREYNSQSLSPHILRTITHWQTSRLGGW